MSRARLASLALPLALITVPGCGEAGPKIASNQKPFEDDWVEEVRTSFPYIAQDANGDDFVNITQVTIGGSEFDKNFENRGDIIVTFDGDDDEIIVEMRRFAWREDKEEAQGAFDKVQLWAYSTSVTSPKPPGQMDEMTSCNRVDPETDDPFPWAEGCGVRLYYEGQNQPTRLGADLRVTLPASYRHNVNIVTSDNDEEEDYLNRGDVCVEGLNGSADVTLESGLAYVILDSAMTPGPTCTADEVEACETWTDADGNDDAWNPECPCAILGKVRVETTGSGSSNITIDADSGLWTTMSLDNEGDSQEAGGDHCEATIDWSTGDVEVDQDPSQPWKIRGEANHPAGGVMGAGYNIRGVSAKCAPVLHTDRPGDYVGEGMSDQQESEERGNVTVCNDCLRDMSCEDLLKGI